MKEFLATALTETRVSNDRRRFELTFVDADGHEHMVSIPSSIAGGLVPVLEAVAAAQAQAAGGEMTRLPKTCAVGHATGDRMVLLRFDDEAPYAIEPEVAHALAEQLQAQTSELSDSPRPVVH